MNNNVMDEQKVLEKARAYCIAYQRWVISYVEGYNYEQRKKFFKEVKDKERELLETITEGI